MTTGDPVRSRTGFLADAGRALRPSPAAINSAGEAQPSFPAQADQAIERIEG